MVLHMVRKAIGNGWALHSNATMTDSNWCFISHFKYVQYVFFLIVFRLNFFCFFVIGSSVSSCAMLCICMFTFFTFTALKKIYKSI